MIASTLTTLLSESANKENECASERLVTKNNDMILIPTHLCHFTYTTQDFCTP